MKHWFLLFDKIYLYFCLKKLEIKEKEDEKSWLDAVIPEDIDYDS